MLTLGLSHWGILRMEAIASNISLGTEGSSPLYLEVLRKGMYYLYQNGVLVIEPASSPSVRLPLEGATSPTSDWGLLSVGHVSSTSLG